MGWFVFIVLLLFYVLGLFVFHATGPIHILPFVAVAALIGYLWLVRRSGDGTR
jgi:hypothetical protein